MRDESRATGWSLFAAILLAIAGALSVVWGIAAIGDSKFFAQNATYILSGLHTWGWIVLVIGVIQLVAAASLLAGGEFGRWVGILAAALAAWSALLSIPAYPLWSLCVFALAIIILAQLAAAPERPIGTPPEVVDPEVRAGPGT
jgi:hypothetical protein